MIDKFLTDLKNNNEVMQLLGNPTNLIDSMISYYQQLSNRRYTYAVYKPKNKDFGFIEIKDGKVIKKGLGTVLTVRWGGLVNRPYNIRKVGNEIWIASLYTRLRKFDENFSYLGEFGVWGDEFPDKYVHPRDFVVTDEHVVIVCEWRHRVVCYKRDTAESVWMIGDGQAGNPQDGRVWNPYSIDVLPDGNYILASFYGQPEGAITNGGFVAKVDKDTGNMTVLLSYKKDGFPWNGDVCHPIFVRVYDNEVWISYWDRDIIAVFEYTGDALVYKRTYGRTSGLNVGAIRIRAFSYNKDEGRVYLTADAPKKIACLDAETHDLLGHFGFVRWEDYNNNPETPGAFLTPSGIIELGDNLVVCDYSNNRVQLIPKEFLFATQFDVEYELDYGEEVDNVLEVSDTRFDLANKKFSLSVDDILSLSELPKVYALGKYV
jgi:hypothetical protein